MVTKRPLLGPGHHTSIGLTSAPLLALGEKLEPPAEELPRCFDASRCPAAPDGSLRGSLRVFFARPCGRGGCLVGNVANSSSGGRTIPWAAPAGVQVARRATEACLLIVQLDYGWNRSRSAYHFTPADAPRLAAWRSFGGRNTIVVDASDHGTPAATARKYLGDCPIVAATHAVSVRTMRPSVDISLPLPPREPCCEGLHALSASLWMLDGAARRYWVTFRGTTYFGGEGKRRDELLALDGQREPHDGGRVAVVRLGCHKLHGEHLLLANRHRCERLEASLRTAPSFVELLNATFALLPAGRQPATLRLNEAMAAATIPIFVAGDARAPYVPPYSQLIDWHTIALNVGWSELPRLPRMLSSLTPAKVAAMQQGVRRAWLRHLRPDTGATQRAFYAIAAHAFTSRLQPGGWSNVSMRTHLVRAMVQ